MNTLKDQQEAASMAKKYVLTEDVFTTVDGKKLRGKNDEQGMLLGRKGDEVDLSRAVELGIAKGEKKEAKKAEDKAHKKGENK